MYTYIKSRLMLRLKQARLKLQQNKSVNNWKKYNHYQKKEIVKINCPILLFSEIQRSGGTLLGDSFTSFSYLLNTIAVPHFLQWTKNLYLLK